MKRILCGIALLSAVFLGACKHLPAKTREEHKYGSTNERVIENVSPTPTPAAPPGPFDRKVDPTGRESRPASSFYRPDTSN